jgi:hypothetical protein
VAKVRNLAFAAFAPLPVQASALCFHDGKISAKATLSQDFRESAGIATILQWHIAPTFHLLGDAR